MLKGPAIGLAAALAAGIWLAEAGGQPAAAAWAATAASLLGLAVAGWRRRGRGLAAHLVVVAVGALVMAAQRPPADSEPAAGWASEARWRVRVQTPVARQVDERGARYAFGARATHRLQGGSWRGERAHLRLSLPIGDGSEPPARGDLLEVRLTLRRWVPGQAQGAAAMAERLRRVQVSHVARVHGAWAQVEEGRGFAHRLDVWRQRAGSGFWAHLPPSAASLAQALALGDPAALTPARREAWATAGMAHLLCVSGLHVGMVAGFFWALAWAVLALLPGAGQRFNLRRWAAAAALPAVVLFALVCGAPLAATRAALMAALATLSLLLGQAHSARNGLAWAALLILFSTPQALWSPSFWLSFAAVAALLAAARPAAACLPPARRPVSRASRVAAWLLRGLRGAWAASLAATVATAPITALVFHQVAWLGVFSNLVAVPLGTLAATPLALAQALAANVAPAWQRLPAALLAPTLAALDGLAHQTARLPGASLDVPPPTPCELLAFAALTCALWARPRLGWRWRRPGRWAGWAAATVLGLATGRRALVSGWGDGRLHVHHLPVGQGDATLLLAPRGGAMLVDGGGALTPGGWDPGAGVVAPALRRLGVRRLDFVVMTHPHPDHIGGLQRIARGWPVGRLVHSGTGADFATVRRLLAAAGDGGAEVVTVAALPSSIAWSGLTLSFLHPRSPAGGPWPGWGLNDNSVVVRVDHGQRSLLLTGDIERRGETLLAAEIAPVDVLKVPHHGSRTSTSAAFLAAAAPAAATILCGPGNVFGFPHAEVLARLHGQNIRVWRTDQVAHLHFWSDGTQWFGLGDLGRSPAADPVAQAGPSRGWP